MPSHMKCYTVNGIPKDIVNDHLVNTDSLLTTEESDLKPGLMRNR